MKTKKLRKIAIVLCFLLSSVLVFACQGEQEQNENQETEVERVDTESIDTEGIDTESIETEATESNSADPESADTESADTESADTESEEVESVGLENTFQQISASEAKELMEESDSFVLLDVREENEFKEGHIRGATLIPVGQIAQLAPELLQDKEALILVYCRSGRRSVEASQQLVDLGYTQVVEFGGILDWPYEVVRD